jgi:hypothetical protein
MPSPFSLLQIGTAGRYPYIHLFVAVIYGEGGPLVLIEENESDAWRSPAHSL